MTPEQKGLAEKIFVEFIGNGQIGVDFNKEHIFQALESYHEQLQEKESVEFAIWKDHNYIKLGSPHYFYVAKYAELPELERHKFKLSELYKLFNESTKRIH